MFYNYFSHLVNTAGFCDGFYNSCNIMDELYRGWALGVGGKPKAGNTIHKETNSSAVSSVGHRNCHSQLGRHRRSSAVV